MARTITLKSAKQRVNNEGDELQMVFTLSGEGLEVPNEEHQMEGDKGIRVADWGDLDWSYDFEDALLVPGTYQFTLDDADSWLYKYLFGREYIRYQKNAEVRLLLNGVTEYVGNLQEDSIKFDRGSRRATMTADPYSIILNQQQLFDSSSQPVNPFKLQQSMYYRVTYILEQMYGLISPLIKYDRGSLVINHDWSFYGRLQNPNSPYNLWELWDGKFTELFQLGDPIFFWSEYGLSTVSDALKKLALDWCAFTGLIHKEKAFFKKLFTYDPANLQAVNVLNVVCNYAYSTIDYVSVDAQGKLYSLGTNTHLEGRLIERKSIPAFVMDRSFTSVKAGITRGLGQDGYYNVYGVSDPVLTKGQLVDSGRMQTMFWYNFRHFLANCRVDDVSAKGIAYDYTKDFNFDGDMYQPISLKKKLSQNRSEFRALHIGRIPS
jgi:hypothetical protein